MLYICHGARGVGKTTVLAGLAASGITVVGPPTWEAFDKFAADPGRNALRNQQEALHAHAAVILAGLARQGPCATDASLLRVRLFSRTLLSLGYLSAADYASLNAADRNLTTSVDEKAVVTFHLACREEARLERLAARDDPATCGEELTAIQRQADRDLIRQSARVICRWRRTEKSA
jgi:predicted kinase